jgi:PhzF family phenazine biosynthesis protein
MNLRIFQVDAFTEKPMRGNPAGVCILEKVMPDEWMQGIAKEMNLSETAFIKKEGDSFSLRWFTPKVEVDLCGHATLATAHILYKYNYLPISEVARFQTKSGLQKAKSNGVWIELDFPQTPVSNTEIPDGLEKALGAKISYMGKSIFDYFAVLENDKVVKELNPDFKELAKYGMRGIIVTASSSSFDFVSRFFAPQSGINEDPVTGSAHSALYPYWSNKLGKQQMLAYQASERSGILKLDSIGDRVLIAGQAVTIFEGNLKV